MHTLPSLVFVALSFGTVTSQATASASDATRRCDLYEADCYSRPLENGRPGEMVRVCDKVRLVCSDTPSGRMSSYSNNAQRMGTTTVEHY